MTVTVQSPPPSPITTTNLLSSFTVHQSSMSNLTLPTLLSFLVSTNFLSFWVFTAHPHFSLYSLSSGTNFEALATLLVATQSYHFWASIASAAAVDHDLNSKSNSQSNTQRHNSNKFNIAIIECPGGTDKDPHTGHRVDTAFLVQSLKKFTSTSGSSSTLSSVFSSPSMDSHRASQYSIHQDSSISGSQHSPSSSREPPPHDDNNIRTVFYTDATHITVLNDLASWADAVIGRVDPGEYESCSENKYFDFLDDLRSIRKSDPILVFGSRNEMMRLGSKKALVNLKGLKEKHSIVDFMSDTLHVDANADSTPNTGNYESPDQIAHHIANQPTDPNVAAAVAAAVANTAHWDLVPESTQWYQSFQDFRKNFPAHLFQYGDRVLKQNRGSKGEGIYWVQLLPPSTSQSPCDLSSNSLNSQNAIHSCSIDTNNDKKQPKSILRSLQSAWSFFIGSLNFGSSPMSYDTVMVQVVEAKDNHKQIMSLKHFLSFMQSEFTRRKDFSVLDMEYLPRIIEGEIRLVLSGKTVLYVVDKRPSFVPQTREYTGFQDSLATQTCVNNDADQSKQCQNSQINHSTMNKNSDAQVHENNQNPTQDQEEIVGFSANLGAGASHRWSKPNRWRRDLVDPFMKHLDEILERMMAPPSDTKTDKDTAGGSHVEAPLLWTVDFIRYGKLDPSMVNYIQAVRKLTKSAKSPWGNIKAYINVAMAASKLLLRNLIKSYMGEKYVISEINASCVGFSQHPELGDDIAAKIIKLLQEKRAQRKTD